MSEISSRPSEENNNRGDAPTPSSLDAGAEGRLDRSGSNTVDTPDFTPDYGPMAAGDHSDRPAGDTTKNLPPSDVLPASQSGGYPITSGRTAAQLRAETAAINAAAEEQATPWKDIANRLLNGNDKFSEYDAWRRGDKSRFGSAEEADAAGIIGAIAFKGREQPYRYENEDWTTQPPKPDAQQ
jgi:hypothetical protein